MWYGRVMAGRNPQLNWDRLLDGGTYTLNLHAIGWQRGLNDLRAKVHYEADRRRGVAHTHKRDPWTLEISSEHCEVKRVPVACTCGTKPWEGHVITCAVIRRPDLKQASAPQERPPTPNDQAVEPDDEALLGSCTCGQAPGCAPDCARVTGLAA